MPQQPCLSHKLTYTIRRYSDHSQRIRFSSLDYRVRLVLAPFFYYHMTPNRSGLLASFTITTSTTSGCKSTTQDCSTSDTLLSYLLLLFIGACLVVISWFTLNLAAAIRKKKIEATQQPSGWTQSRTRRDWITTGTVKLEDDQYSYGPQRVYGWKSGTLEPRLPMSRIECRHNRAPFHWVMGGLTYTCSPPTEH